MAQSTFPLSERLLGTYLSRRQEDVRVCHEALSPPDFPTLQTVGHRLKGNGASFGYPELAELGAELESAAQDGDLEAARQCVIRLESWVKSKTPDPSTG